MKLFLMLIAAIVISSIFTYGHSQVVVKSNPLQIARDDVINVYYFHFTRRCATCQAVEEQSASALNTLYPDQIKSGQIVFTSVNLEEESSESLAESLQVSGQALLVVIGQKKIDLTDDGFMYARTNPEKLQEKIKNTIDPLF